MSKSSIVPFWRFQLSGTACRWTLWNNCQENRVRNPKEVVLHCFQPPPRCTRVVLTNSKGRMSKSSIVPFCRFQLSGTACRWTLWNNCQENRVRNPKEVVLHCFQPPPRCTRVVLTNSKGRMSKSSIVPFCRFQLSGTAFRWTLWNNCQENRVRNPKEVVLHCFQPPPRCTRVVLTNSQERMSKSSIVPFWRFQLSGTACIWTLWNNSQENRVRTPKEVVLHCFQPPPRCTRVVLTNSLERMSKSSIVPFWRFKLSGTACRWTLWNNCRENRVRTPKEVVLHCFQPPPRCTRVVLTNSKERMSKSSIVPFWRFQLSGTACI